LKVLQTQKIKQAGNATKESNKFNFIDSKKKKGYKDYKLRWCFLRHNPFFEGGQLVLPLFSSSDKCLRSQLSRIKVRCLGQTSLNFGQSCPLCYLLLQDFIILGFEPLQPSDLFKTHRFSLGQMKIGPFDHLLGLLNFILSIKKSAIGSVNGISNFYFPCFQLFHI